MRSDGTRLSAEARTIVLHQIQSVADHESWTLHAAHVRSAHVHAVITADVKPETVLGKLKAYSSRALNQTFGKQTKRWSRHGSTVWLWDPRQLQHAIQYVIHGQGVPMACYLDPKDDS